MRVEFLPGRLSRLTPVGQAGHLRCGLFISIQPTVLHHFRSRVSIALSYIADNVHSCHDLGPASRRDAERALLLAQDRCRCAKNSRKCRPTHPTGGADQQTAKVKSAFQYRWINAPRRALFVFIKWEHIGGADRLPALRSSSRLTSRRQDGPLLCGLLMSRSTKMLHGFRPDVTIAISHIADKIWYIPAMA